MPRQAERQDRATNDNSWFTRELRVYADEQALGKNVSSLLVASAKIKAAELSDEEFRRYKRAALHFIAECLVEVEEGVQDAFFMFLLQSALIDDSPEVRTAMHLLLKSRLGGALDRLSINIAAALLRSNKFPAPNVLAEVFGKAKEQYARNPDWMLVGIFVSAVGRVRNPTYSTEDLIADLVKLKSPEFDKAVRLRNPLWESLNPPADAISIITKVRQLSQRHTPNDLIMTESRFQPLKKNLRARFHHFLGRNGHGSV